MLDGSIRENLTDYQVKPDNMREFYEIMGKIIALNKEATNN